MSSLPEPLITITPEYLSVAPAFTGTRVSFQPCSTTSKAGTR
jgi:hypothetical protein